MTRTEAKKRADAKWKAKAVTQWRCDLRNEDFATVEEYRERYGLSRSQLVRLAVEMDIANLKEQSEQK